MSSDWPDQEVRRDGTTVPTLVGLLRPPHRRIGLATVLVSLAIMIALLCRAPSVAVGKLADNVEAYYYMLMWAWALAVLPLYFGITRAAFPATELSVRNQRTLEIRRFRWTRTKALVVLSGALLVWLVPTAAACLYLPME